MRLYSLSQISGERPERPGRADEAYPSLLPSLTPPSQPFVAISLTLRNLGPRFKKRKEMCRNCAS